MPRIASQSASEASSVIGGELGVGTGVVVGVDAGALDPQDTVNREITAAISSIRIVNCFITNIRLKHD